MIKKYNDFTWWLNKLQASTIDDKDFIIARNVYYNNNHQVQTRRWYRKFWSQIWSAPVSSYFFYQRDDTLERIAICFSGWVMYKYNESTNARDSIKTGLLEYETLPWLEWKRTRRDFAVYKNVIYMCDWVNIYSQYNWTTYTNIGVWSLVSCTFNSSTDIITSAWHWLTAWSEVFFTGGAMPAWIAENQVYYVITITTDTFQVSTSPAWSAVNFTTNWTGVSYKALSEPRCRYLQYLQDTLIGAWDDGNPISLYYTNTQPTDWTNLNQNVVVVWWDEQGIVNWLNEFGQVILAFKDKKVYAVNLATPWVSAIDTQWWWYSDRSIDIVWNSMVYFTDRWIDTLQKRSWVDWSTAIEWSALWEKVQPMTKKVKPLYYNSNAWIYIRPFNNYYFTFDANQDDRPDTTLVYNSWVKSFTEYEYPPLYDYGEYKDSQGNIRYLFTSALGGQVYEMEYWFTDDWAVINSEIQTKPFDLWDPAQVYTCNFVDIVWWIQEWWEITAKVLTDWEVSQEAIITDSNAWWDNTLSLSSPLWISPIWVDSLWWKDLWIDLTMYPFTVRVPLYWYFSTIALNLSASWTQWIFEKMRIEIDWQPIELYPYNNIL